MTLKYFFVTLFFLFSVGRLLDYKRMSLVDKPVSITVNDTNNALSSITSYRIEINNHTEFNIVAMEPFQNS